MITVILCAAGSGKRAGLPENKVLHELNGMPVLCYSLSAFAPFADEFLVACREEDEDAIKRLLTPYPNARTVLGGSERALSVYYALQEAKGDVVLVHDGARPFVTRKVIEDCIASVMKHGSGVAAVAVTDTVARAIEGHIADMPPRKELYALQTPQGFYTKKLLEAYERAYAEERELTFTDDSGIYAAYVEPPRLFEGDRRNKKLTYAEDWPAERIGFGVDTHAFGAARDYIVLAGVKIPSASGLVAHSDGDVLVHALMDALLSAIGERDIGYHFPDTDPALRGADSMKMLAKVMDMVGAKSLHVANASIAVLAETPRLAPYIEDMKSSLCAALSCPNVAIAAGTNEKLGYVGEGKGITVYATVLLK